MRVGCLTLLRFSCEHVKALTASRTHTYHGAAWLPHLLGSCKRSLGRSPSAVADTGTKTEESSCVVAENVTFLLSRQKLCLKNYLNAGALQVWEIGAEHDPLAKAGLYQSMQVTQICSSGHNILKLQGAYINVDVRVRVKQRCQRLQARPPRVHDVNPQPLVSEQHFLEEEGVASRHSEVRRLVRNRANVISDRSRPRSHVNRNRHVKFFCQPPIWLHASVIRRHPHKLRHELAEHPNSPRSELGAQPCGVGEIPRRWQNKQRQ